MSTQVRVEVETWRNPGPCMVFLRRLDHRGELAAEETIPAGRTLTISPAERELLQRQVATPEQDWFTNGTLVPVQLIEGSDIALAVATNPNLLSDDDMQRVVGGKGRSKEAADEAFNAKLAVITNGVTLQRMLDVAVQMDAPHSRVLAVQQRLAVVEGMGLQTEPAETEKPNAGRGGRTPRQGVSRPVTPS